MRRTTILFRRGGTEKGQKCVKRHKGGERGRVGDRAPKRTVQMRQNGSARAENKGERKDRGLVNFEVCKSRTWRGVHDMKVIRAPSYFTVVGKISEKKNILVDQIDQLQLRLRLALPGKSLPG